jgi:hypothetical protein
MSTRATYTFKDGRESFSVYVHHDGYPTGAADKLRATLESDKIWELPRFEVDEFAAGFIAVNKTQGGSVRLLKKPSSVGDAAYRYTIRNTTKGLQVKVESGWEGETLWTGSLADFIENGAESIE